MGCPHLSICTNGDFHSKAPQSPEHCCITSDISPKHPDQHLWEVSSSRKTISAVLGVRGYKPPSNLVTRKTVQDAEPVLFRSSLPSAAQGKRAAPPFGISTKAVTGARFIRSCGSAVGTATPSKYKTNCVGALHQLISFWRLATV